MQDLTPGNVKAAFGPNSQDLWMAAPDKLRIIPGYNVRPLDPERVRWLADRMKVNGYDRKHPLGGYVAKIDGVDVACVTAGHHRHAAITLAIAEGALIEKVPMIVSPRGANMEELTVELITSNEGNPLTTYQKAEVVKRLAAFGWDSAKIADRVGLSSAAYVDDLLLLAGAPLAVRRMVMEDVVSATLAISTLKKHGDKAHDVLTAALTGTTKRVTAKALPQAELKKAIRKQSENLYLTATLVHKDPAFSQLSEGVRDALTKLLEAIK